MVVVVQLKGMLSIGNTGAGRVTVASIVAFGFCYGCDSIAICTSVLNFERERIIKKITFIFSTGVVGCKWDNLGVFWEKGKLPSLTVTIMVGVFWVQIPTAAHIGKCTTEGVPLDIINFPNYVIVVFLSPLSCHHHLSLSSVSLLSLSFLSPLYCCRHSLSSASKQVYWLHSDQKPLKVLFCPVSK